MSNFSTPLPTPKEYLSPRLTKSDVTAISVLHGFAYLMAALCIGAILLLGWSLFKIYNSPQWNFDTAKLSQVQLELIALQTGSARYNGNIKAVNSRMPVSLPYYVAASKLPTGLQLKSVDYTESSTSEGATGKLFVAMVTIQGSGPEGSGSALEDYVGKINALDPSQIDGFTPKAALTQSSIAKATDPNAPGTLTFSVNLTLSTPLP